MRQLEIGESRNSVQATEMVIASCVGVIPTERQKREFKRKPYDMGDISMIRKGKKPVAIYGK